jgi:hypothetical protein
MWLSDISVRRPLVAVVISALLTVFGLVAFSRLLGRFQKIGLIKVKGKYVTILDTAALSQIAGSAGNQTPE